MSRALIIPFILVLLVGGTSQSFATNTPTIELEKTVHFLTPGGEDVVVDPGTYEVEAADEWLRLIPQRGHRIDAILMNAQVGKHEEVIKSPHAKSEQRGEDQHLVALMLPNGTTLEAVGSYSGVSSRGLSSRLRRPLRKRLIRKPTTQVRRPHIKVIPTDLIAKEVGPDPGVVTIARTGRINYPLIVEFHVTGNATLGGTTPDFHIALPPSQNPGQYLLTIPAGSSKARIIITPVDDPFEEREEFVRLNMQRCLNNVPCMFDEPRMVRITIADNDSRPSNSGPVPNDAFEPNNTQDSSFFLGAVSDADSNGSSLTAAIQPRDDEDWYRFQINTDEVLSTLNPSYAVTAAQGLQACIYFQCVEGTTDMTCPGGTTNAVAPNGAPGCCGNMNATVIPNCQGSIKDIGDVWLRVLKPGGESASIPYGLEWHP